MRQERICISKQEKDPSQGMRLLGREAEPAVAVPPPAVAEMPMPKPEAAPDTIHARDFPGDEALPDKDLNLDGMVHLLLLSFWPRSK